MDLSATPRITAGGAAALKGRVYTWDGLALYARHSINSTMHTHFSALLMIGLEGSISLSVEDGRQIDLDVVVMAPNVPHGTDSHGRPFLSVMVDPDDDLYRYIHPLLDGASLRPLPAMPEPLRRRCIAILRGELTCAEASAFTLQLFRTLCPEPLHRLPWDERILRACAYLRVRIPHKVPTAAEVAAHVGLSESRLSHLFSENFGISMRQCALWLRLRHAVRLWTEGRNLTDIALGAGFCDLPHFTGVLRRLGGLVPSELNAVVTITRCDWPSSNVLGRLGQTDC